MSARSSVLTGQRFVARFLLAGMILPASWVSAHGVDSGPDDTIAVVESAVAFVERYRDTLESRDLEAVRKLFVDDDRFAWFTDGKKRYASAGDVIRGLEELAASGVMLSTEFSNLKAHALGTSQAAVSTDFQTQGFVGGKEAFQFGGVITMLLEKSVDGRWRVLSGHTSTPAGPPSE